MVQDPSSNKEHSGVQKLQAPQVIDTGFKPQEKKRSVVHDISIGVIMHDGA